MRDCRYPLKWTEIHLDAVSHNYRILREKMGPAVELMGVVKAEAYGHGAVEVARHLEKLGVDQLGVAIVEEGLELRGAGIKSPIVVLTGANSGEFGLVMEGGLIPVLHQMEMAEALNAFAQERKKKIPVHLKFNTGMNRLGFSLRELPSLLNWWREWKGLEVIGVMTHLACGDQPDHELTREQRRCFDFILREIEECGLKIRYAHLAASSAVLSGYGYGDRFNLVRSGLALYGESPFQKSATSLQCDQGRFISDGEILRGSFTAFKDMVYPRAKRRAQDDNPAQDDKLVQDDEGTAQGQDGKCGDSNDRQSAQYEKSYLLGLAMELRPVMEVKTRVLALQDVHAGESVSYGAAFRCERESRIAVLPFGYADGYCRAPKNCSVLLSGKQAPVVGNVCMDLMMVDVTEIGSIEVGDEAVLLGAQGPARISAGELAERFGTIPYDVLCRLSGRGIKSYMVESL
ncbi:MAG: alanine racemase [Deltaproteobacteria bacterium]|nr:alanine racemase [Deltaproteobacteria bacterium]